MPGHLHQAFVELFVRRPELAAELLATVFGVAVPAHATARTEAAEFTDLRPVELRADVVVVLGAAEPVYAVVVEVQMRPDVRKRRTWPGYLTAAGLRWECPAALLVVCADEATASWCAQPIEIGHPGFVLAPLVLGPAQVPVVDDPAEAARTPELAVMSAVAHGGDPARSGVLDALVGALATVDPDRATLYTDIVLAALPQAAHRYLEALMRSGTYELQTEFARNMAQRIAQQVAQGRARGVAEGRAEGLAQGVAEGLAQGVAEGLAQGVAEGLAQGVLQGKVQSLLTMLEARGLKVPAAVRARIEGCTDLDQLENLTRRAVSVASAEELFDRP